MRRTRLTAVGLIGATLLATPALAQTKPPPSGTVQPAAPGGKFAPPPAAAAPTPGPATPIPAPGAPGGKFAQTAPATPAVPLPTLPTPDPATPKLAPPRSADAPTVPPPAFAAPVQPPVAAPAAPTRPPATAAVPAAVPADEPATVRRLRTMLGADTTVTYASVDIIDPNRGSVRLREVRLRGPDRTATFDELTLDGLRDDGIDEGIARNAYFSNDLQGGASMARLRLVGIRARAPAPGQPFMPSMLSADLVRMEDLRTQGADGLRIAELSVEDYGNGRSGRVTLAGFSVNTPGAAPMLEQVRIARVLVRGLDFAALLQALIAKEMPARPTGSYAMEMDGFSLLQAQDRVLGGIESMRATQDIAPNRPEVGRFALLGIRIEPFPGLDTWLQRFGFTNVVGDLTGESREEHGTQRLQIPGMTLSVRDAGTLSLAIEIDGWDAAQAQANSLSPDQVRLVSMRLRYRDAGLTTRLLRDQARSTGASEAQLRQQFAAQAGGMAAMGSPADAAALAPIGDAVQRFIRGEATEIEISLRPPQPVPFNAFSAAGGGGPAAAQRALGITATAR